MSGRYLVTGAAGLVGFEVVRQLLERGQAVRSVDRFKKAGRADLDALAAVHKGKLEIVAQDLARESAAVRGERWESVFHLAAIVGVAHVRAHPYETLEVNLRSTLNLLDACIERAPGSVVFTSSSENYAGGIEAGALPIPTPEDVPLSISDVTEPRWSYAASKIAGESMLFSAARESRFVPIVVRLHNVYGPRMPPTHAVPEILARCKRKVDPFPLYGPEQTRSFLHVSDCARALLLLHERVKDAAGGIYNIGSGRETRIDELAKLCFDVSGHHPRIEHQPHSPGSVARRVPDVKKLEALGWKQTIKLEDGVAECWRALAGR
jgi:UDP-glucose 4-epimerase/UDP-glucuronate decarboxylase